MGDATEGLVVGDIDLTQLRAWRERFPALRDRRVEVYAALERKDGTPIEMGQAHYWVIGPSTSAAPLLDIWNSWRWPR